MAVKSKKTLTSKFKSLFVKKLLLLTEEEFKKLLERAEISGSFSSSKDRFDVNVTYFDEPLFSELIKFFNFSSSVCFIHVKLHYLYNTSAIYRLVSEWFKYFSFNSEEREKFFLKENHIVFEFPQLILKAENLMQEKYFSFHLDHLKSFLEYVFEYHKIWISFVKVDSVPTTPTISIPENRFSFRENEGEFIPPGQDRNIRKGLYKLYFFEEIENYSYRKKKAYQVGFTNLKEHYFLILGRLVDDKKRDLILEKLKIGKWFQIEFKLDLENLSKTKTLANYDGWLINCLEAESPDETQFTDNSEKKAFPLNVYTKYSSFDGLFTSAEWAKLSAECGYDVLALTDFNNVHSFPESEKSVKKNKLKALYGAEFEVVSSDLQIIKNVENLKPEDDIVFSIFDLETTGLNPIFDEIIEIFVLKYSSGTVIDHYYSLIRCNKKLRKEIINLTHITEEKLNMSGRDKLTVLQEVRDFVSGTVLIAHNGIDFDFPFLNSELRKSGLEPLDNPILDTLRLCKALEEGKKSKSYSLFAIAKKMSINVVEQELHNSEYDTRCLAKMWEFWSQQLIDLSLDPYTYDGLVNLNSSFDKDKLLRNYFGNNVIIFAKNQKGLKSLYELVSIAHTEHFVDKPRLKWDAIETRRENLIVLSSPTNSALVNAVLNDEFDTFKKEGEKFDYISLPPPSNFSHEISRGFFEDGEVETLLKTFYEWADNCQFKLIANYCLKYQDFKEVEQYKVLVHAKSIGGKRHYLYSSKHGNDVLPDYSWRTTERLIAEYDFLSLSEKEKEDLFFTYRYELANSVSPDIFVNKSELAIPKIPGALENIKEYIHRKLTAKYGKKLDKQIQATINRELTGIVENGYESVYWCAHLLVQRSKSEGFLVGSRGSVGSSFLAHALEISDVNPLPPHYYCSQCSYFLMCTNFRESGFDLETRRCPQCASELSSDGQNIPFETFLGLERNKIPDIDLNFSGQYQQKAHNFLRELFGKEHTFRAGTISAIAEKTSFALAKNFLQDNQIDFNKGHLHWLSYRLTDVKRTTGQHPGGIIVIPRGESIYNYTPVNFPANDIESEWLTTHFDKDTFKDSLFKFDILGQDDPTILALLSNFTGVDLEKIPFKNERLLKMFSDISVLEIPQNKLELLGEVVGTLGLPEFGTEKTREIMKACRSKIKHFSDLIRISGISHGKNVWKNNIEKLISSQKLSLNEVITCRDDIMNYLLEKKIDIQNAFKITESVRRGGGIPPENLPLLRKAGVPEWYIECANKITYIFPKAHATAYVLMCWKIAYFKLEYPVDFYAAYLTITNRHFDVETLTTNDLATIKRKYQEGKMLIKSKKSGENIEKTKYLVIIYEVALEMISRGITFKMVDLNESLASTFKPDRKNKTILLPFSSIARLGAITAKQLEDERNRGGKFLNREDLEKRVKLNVSILKLLEQLKIIEPKVKSS
ncbi:DNA polymerase III, polC-type [Mycoplasma suis KI3806]|uniref:DNA polymerase III PolC-type n=1 Tax=Mycoplasma suis (strain KI_3806) TaxID=708248 RepID=F0V3L8_MYCS3|nr:PolC-type DNA polymerase III [Mycoplasma suis]CBZ40440.1 DNA polymerase III, polC-type [Mycoplasma suis KI3806]